MRNVIVMTMLCLSSSAVIGHATEVQSVEGTWAVTGAATEGATESGGTWSRREVAGTLVLTQRGAEVTGTWSRSADQAWSLTGKFERGRFELRSEPRQVPVVIDGTQTTVAMRWTFRGESDADTLKGTMALHPAAEPPAFFQSFTGRRKSAER